MISSSSWGGADTLRARPRRGRCLGRPRRFRRSRGGVSDVVGTILLLALTVTLFASIFFFVNTFPRPPSQPANQFQATLGFGGASGNSITSVKITHLAGPTLTGPNIFFYLYSSAQPSAFPTPFTLADGLGGSYVWNLGQTWTLDVTSKGLTVPDNLTVSISTTTELLFHATLPGSNPNIPPEFVNSGTSPLAPAVGQAFTVFTQIVDDDLNSHSVFVNVSQLPGATGSLSKPIQMTYSASNGLWSYTVPAGTTSGAGTFYLFVNATDLIHQINSIAIPVTLAAGSGGGTQANVVLTATPSAPVRGTTVTLTALVSNPGGQSAGVSVNFSAGGTVVGSASGSVGAGSSTSLSTTWTPLASGTVLLTATANVTGSGSASGAISLTIFPKIWFIAHNVYAGTNPKVNESALFALHLTAAGVPFNQTFVPCNSALPTTLANWDVVIIDFGSGNTVGSTCASPSSTDQGKIVTASSSTSFWVLGSDAFASTACSSYTSAYLNLFGIAWKSGSTCTTVQSGIPVSASWTSAAASGLRADGIGTIKINGTLGGSSAFNPAYTFAQGVAAGGTAFLSTSSGKIGTFHTGTHRYVALATTGELLADALPNSASWASGGPSSAVIYNVLGYLCGFANSTSPGRALVDFGIGGSAIAGTNHASATNVYVAVRSNGPVAGVVTVTLYVNGTEAFYQGVPVTLTVSVGANGASTYGTLVWKAPGAASYTLSIGITTSPADLYAPNNLAPLALIGGQIAFV